MAITLLLDTSIYQGNIDWSKVAETSYRGAVVRMTVGMGVRDDHGRRDLARVLDTLPLAGAYGVVGLADPVTDGAKFLVDEIAAVTDPRKILVMLDAEDFTGGRHPTIDDVDTYAAQLHAELGRWPVAYVPGWWLAKYGYTAAGRGLSNCPWAQSHYHDPPWTETRLQVFRPALAFGFRSLAWLQFTSSASVSGIPERVDGNVFYGTESDLRARLLGQQEDDMGQFEGFTVDGKVTFQKAIREVLNEGTGRGQTSWASTEAAILGNVQALTNLVREAKGTLAGNIADVRSAVLGAIAALPAPETPEQAEAAAARILEALANLGVEGLSPDAVLDALHQRLAA